MPNNSYVLSVPPASPAETAAAMREKLRLHTDAWDLAADLAKGIDGIVVVDTRSRDHYWQGHIPGALSLPHREMTAECLASLDRSKVYVSYCDGIGCNGSTWGAFNLANGGFQVKELLGGLDFWRRDEHPVARGDEPGSMSGHPLNDCGC